MKTADRKKLLVAQGALHRAEVMVAKEATRDSLRPSALARKLPQLALAALAVFGNRSAAGSSTSKMSTWLPLLTAGVAAIGQGKGRFKPVIRGVLIAGVVAGLTAFVAKTRNSPASDTPQHF